MSAANQFEWSHEVLAQELLARALDSGLHMAPQDVVGGGWATLRDEDVAGLRHMLQVATALQTSAPGVVPSPVWRLRARHRLLAAVDRVEAPASSSRVRTGGRLDWLRSWYARAATALAAASFAGVATAHASTAALPGDPLYAVKQVGEEVALRTADSEPKTAHVLIDQAAARLDETAALIQLGRMHDAAATAQRYQDSVTRAVAAVESGGQARAITPSGAVVTEEVQAKLTAQAREAIDLLGQASEPSHELLDGATHGLAQLAVRPPQPEVIETPGPLMPVIRDIAPNPETAGTPDVSDSGHESSEVAEPAAPNDDDAAPPARGTGVTAGRIPLRVRSTRVSNDPAVPSSSPDDDSPDATPGNTSAVLPPSQAADQSRATHVESVTPGPAVEGAPAADVVSSNQVVGGNPSPTPSASGTPAQAANLTSSDQGASTSGPPGQAGSTPNQGASASAPPSQAGSAPNQVAKSTPSSQGPNNTPSTQTGSGPISPGHAATTSPPPAGQSVSRGAQTQTSSRAVQSQSGTPNNPPSVMVNSSPANKPPGASKP